MAHESLAAQPTQQKDSADLKAKVKSPAIEVSTPSLTEVHPPKVFARLKKSDFVLSKKLPAKVLEKLADGTNSEVRRIEYEGREYAVKALLGKDPKQLEATQNSIAHTKAVLDAAKTPEERALFIENHWDNLSDADASLHYTVMELVRGKDLRQVIQANPEGLPLRVALLIVEDVLIALQIAHRTDKPIRDLKPENILLTENGDIKIADLGGLILSEEERKKLGTTLAPSIIVGSTYGIPENKATATTLTYYDQENPSDPRADLVAVGRLLEELIFGKLRGEAKGRVEQVFDTEIQKRGVLKFNPRVLHQLNEIYDRSQIVLKYRFRDAEEMRLSINVLLQELFAVSRDASDEMQLRKEILAKVPSQTFKDDRHLHYPRAVEVFPMDEEEPTRPVLIPRSRPVLNAHSEKNPPAELELESKEKENILE